MPDGINSIDDLKVVITAETDKMSQGLTNAQQLITTFSSDAGQKLGMFDGAMGKAGSSILAIKDPISKWLDLASAALVVIEKLGDKAGSAAEKLGAGAEWKEFTNSLAGINTAISDFVNGADTSTQAASYLKREVGDTALSFDAFGMSAENTAKGGLIKLTEMMERAAHEARRLTSDDTWKTHTVDAEIRRTQELIDGLKKKLEDTSASGANWLQRMIGIDSPAAMADLKAGIAQYEAELERLAGVRSKAAWRDVAVDTDTAKLLQGIEREIEGLRIRNATLGMSAPAAAAYAAGEKVRAEAERGGAEALAAANAELARRLPILEAQHAKREAFAKAEQDRQQAEREAERQEKGGAGLVEGLDRELSAIRAKERALGDMTAATKAQDVEERVLAMARQRNITVTDEMRLQIKAYAFTIGEADVALREHQKMLGQVGQGVGVVFKGIETIISRTLDGSQLKMRDVTASMLNDLSALVLKMMVLKPLQDSISGGITGSLTSIGSTLFGGARASGGPVEAGSTYLVGEQGPELFTAKNSGTIIANDKLRGAASGGGSGAVYVTIHQPINAQGAYPESIEQIKQAMAEQNSRLPGRVMEVVTDARERGGM
jgi:hypothetical protein